MDYDLWGNIDASEPIFGMKTGKTVLRTHDAAQCAGEACCLHNPSDHALNDAPLNWRGDRGLMERICGHGVGHPDPDDLAHKRRIFTTDGFKARGFDLHGCDGCCVA